MKVAAVITSLSVSLFGGFYESLTNEPPPSAVVSSTTITSEGEPSATPSETSTPAVDPVLLNDLAPGAEIQIIDDSRFILSRRGWTEPLANDVKFITSRETTPPYAPGHSPATLIAPDLATDPLANGTLVYEIAEIAKHLDVNAFSRAGFSPAPQPMNLTYYAPAAPDPISVEEMASLVEVLVPTKEETVVESDPAPFTSYWAWLDERILKASVESGAPPSDTPAPNGAEVPNAVAWLPGQQREIE